MIVKGSVNDELTNCAMQSMQQRLGMTTLFASKSDFWVYTQQWIGQSFPSTATGLLGKE